MKKENTSMCKGLCWGIIGAFVLFGMTGLVWAAEEDVINNPNYAVYLKAHPLETKPRDPKVVETETQLIREAAQAMAEYAKTNGAEQAAAEVTKGANGAFAKYCVGPQVRLMIFQFTDKGPKGEAGDFFILKGHNLWLALVGGISPIDALADLSGWTYLADVRKVALSPQGRGWVKNNFWLDELWAGNKIVRYLNYVHVIDREKGVAILTCTALDE
jgi:hypothetical protein